MDVEVSSAAIEELLSYFVSDALGLTLTARIEDAGNLPSGHRGCLANSTDKPQGWAAWHTTQGTVSARATYDREQAARMGAHVLKICWWMGSQEHHEGWWHCYPKRPREWIKGSGTREPPTPS